MSVPGPEPEDQPVLHLDQQHCLPPCRQPLLHPPPCHAWPSRQQGLCLRFCHQSHLNTGEQGQRDYRWDLLKGLQTWQTRLHVKYMALVHFLSTNILKKTKTFSAWVYFSTLSQHSVCGTDCRGHSRYIKKTFLMKKGSVISLNSSIFCYNTSFALLWMRFSE